MLKYLSTIALEQLIFDNIKASLLKWGNSLKWSIQKYFVDFVSRITLLLFSVRIFLSFSISKFISLVKASFSTSSLVKAWSFAKKWVWKKLVGLVISAGVVILGVPVSLWPIGPVCFDKLLVDFVDFFLNKNSWLIILIESKLLWNKPVHHCLPTQYFHPDIFKSLAALIFIKI